MSLKQTKDYFRIYQIILFEILKICIFTVIFSQYQWNFFSDKYTAKVVLISFSVPICLFGLLALLLKIKLFFKDKYFLFLITTTICIWLKEINEQSFLTTFTLSTLIYCCCFLLPNSERRKLAKAILYFIIFLALCTIVQFTLLKSKVVGLDSSGLIDLLGIKPTGEDELSSYNRVKSFMSEPSQTLSFFFLPSCLAIFANHQQFFLISVILFGICVGSHGAFIALISFASLICIWLVYKKSLSFPGIFGAILILFYAFLSEANPITHFAKNETSIDEQDVKDLIDLESETQIDRLRSHFLRIQSIVEAKEILHQRPLVGTSENQKTVVGLLFYFWLYGSIISAFLFLNFLFYHLKNLQQKMQGYASSKIKNILILFYFAVLLNIVCFNDYGASTIFGLTIIGLMHLLILPKNTFQKYFQQIETI